MFEKENISDIIKKYDKEKHPIGEGLSDVVPAFSNSRIPLAKLDYFQDSVEENSFWLSNSTNLYQLIPFVHHEEQASIMKEIDCKEMPVSFCRGNPCL